ncbi:ras and Rab interactor-like protein [Chelonoidis abingdonii]|uniref:ras and Rab interactor-like protein n=1 Tax=Chelonoidis abingdonii TaxID=106734 RepID=UPI0013F27DFB|nr:ras and Rab interactor-like protein isoform X1 [Chelonoidis abingdonii]XP_032632141.1 ras and Rab interactor-like protein isoform X1 [Chelonoidis abingdonii]XP_032632142.1 ras and Rab interactor-like protein isoform X1 [Chelonoidis abingdonii]XP_032632143.1 ras and Rab interactor-like protein isoform X1 [Chelonoidis abingdonii]
MPHVSAEDDVDPSGAGNNDSCPQRRLQNGQCQAPAGGQPLAPLTLLERLLLTRGLWQLLSLGLEQATELLRMQPPGTFLVTGTGSGELKALSVQSSGEGHGAGVVCRFQIKEDDSAVCLEGSQLRFLGLLELVAFLSVSRDVLPLPLRLPATLQRLGRAELDACAALGMRFWSPPFKPSATGEEEGENMGSSPEPPSPPESSAPVCCIQVTSEDGALCIINPLFLSEHSSEGWLPAGVLPPFHLPERGGTIRLRNGQGPGLLDKPLAPTDAETDQLGAPEPGKEGEPGKGNDAPPASVKRKLLVRRPAWTMSEDLPSPPPAERQEGPASPHRVSWIEGASDAPWVLKKSYSESSLLGPRDSLLLPPIPELDSLSVSSVEEEADAHPATPRKKHQSAALPGRVLNRLSAVGSALTSFLSAERRLAKRIQELTQEPASYVGGLVQNFVGHVLRGGAARHSTSTDLLQEIRQMISSLKGYLCESSELQDAWEYGDLEEMDLGSVVEAALYKCVLKPLRDCIYGQLLEFHSRDGSLQKLRDHQLSMGRQSLAELGVTASVPDAPALERIQAKLLQMHQAYSPKKKEAQLLKACKLIYEAMNHGTGGKEIYGADDFLPVLTYVLVKCDIVAVQLDVEYMMELLDPSQLQGEGGYYLTTWFGALYHISNFQSAMVTRQISTEAQDSIHRWQRRRTIHHNQHNRRRSQDILYVSFQEPFTNQKAISVPAHMTAASVCMICSKKYGVSNPEAYGLFLVTDSTSQLLAGDSRPQQIRSASLKSHSASSCFVYKLKGEEPEAPLEGDGPTPAQDPM